MRRALWLLCVGLLPWRLGFRLLKNRARARAGDAQVSAALAAAQAVTDIGDPGQFRYRYALYRLVDEADLAIGWMRGKAWRRRWVHRQGARFPENRAFIALTFHLGAGLPALGALGRHDRGVAWIYAMPECVPSGLAGWLARKRLGLIERLTRAPAIPVGGAWRRAEAWLGAGGGVMALVDAPHFGRRKVSNVRLFGREAGLSCGLAELARACGVPVYLYSVRLHGEDGRRVLRVSGPLAATDTGELMDKVAAFLEEELLADPAAWHFWDWGVLELAFPAARGVGPGGLAGSRLSEGRNDAATS